jgi:hypothetical protein
MPTVTMALRPARSEQAQRCGVCDAEFVPAEDSGSRTFSFRTDGQDTLTGVLCGGCHSKWSHGATVTLRTAALPPPPPRTPLVPGM